MANKVDGKVLAISVEDKVSKAGCEYKIYTVIMQDGTIFQAGIEAPSFAVGDEIHVETEEKFGKQQLIITDAAGNKVEGKGGFKGGGGYKAKPPTPWPVPATHGDNCIIRQNAMRHATALVIAGKSDTVGAAVMAEKAIQVARQIEQYTTGRGDSAAADAVSAMVDTDG